MSAVLAPSESADELVTNDSFFAPADTDLVDSLLEQYRATRAQVERLAAIMADELGSVVHYFIEGNAGDDRTHRTLYVDKLFRAEGARAALNAAYWSKALALTDVYDLMPQARRNEWNTMIREHKAPEFTEEAVRPTLLELLNSRARFLAERVDGIFRGLSGHHVTNEPQGFGKRMIIAGVYSDGPWPTENWTKVGLINDLRCVIARFMGRDEPKNGGSSTLVQTARGRSGEWISADGGALRIRVYKVGTAHLEVHPDMAWRLNATLANLHPLAIPPEFRQRPRRASKAWAPIVRPLPHRVLAVLADARQARQLVHAWPERYVSIPNAVSFRSYDVDPAALREAEQVLESLGGVRLYSGCFQFDYPALEVIAEVVNSGCIPDKQSHQFYPTPEALAKRVVQAAEVGPTHKVLEPSAGQGALLAQLEPETAVTAVDVSAVHCEILRKRFTSGGVEVVHADFLVAADNWFVNGPHFDRVIMNPPFADGRARLHTEMAASLVAPGGRLVAILPAGMRGKKFLAGFEHDWSEVIGGAFPGTSVAVCILVADRK